MKRVYIVMSLRRKAEIRIRDWSSGEFITMPTDLCLAEGVVGVLPVFTNKRKAERFVKSQEMDYEILVAEIDVPKNGGGRDHKEG